MAEKSKKFTQKEMLELREAMRGFVDTLPNEDLQIYAQSYLEKLKERMEWRAEESLMLNAIFSKGVATDDDYDWARETLHDLHDLKDSIEMLGNFIQDEFKKRDGQTTKKHPFTLVKGEKTDEPGKSDGKKKRKGS